MSYTSRKVWPSMYIWSSVCWCVMLLACSSCVAMLWERDLAMWPMRRSVEGESAVVSGLIAEREF